MTRSPLALAALCAGLCIAPALQAQTAAIGAPIGGAPLDDSLFRALGGQPGIDALVNDFVPRLVTDPRMGEFFKHARQPHLQQMLAQVFCVVAGGGCTYTGRSIADVHRDMDISKADFNALVEVLQASMDARQIPFATQNRLLAQLAPMHRVIVTTH